MLGCREAAIPAAKARGISNLTHVQEERTLPHGSTPEVSLIQGALQTERQEVLVVAIGASAGGLEACRGLLEALSAARDQIHILVQHMEPNHESPLVDLLASRTAMAVKEATNGMRLERGTLYVIPPGRYLSVANGMLQVGEPTAPRGMRLPFDFLLKSVATAYGDRAACLVLSGTGADGSVGLVSIHDAGGLVIAQDPQQAAFDGMPTSAIATGFVDHVLAVEDIPAALNAFTGGGGRPVRQSPDDTPGAREGFADEQGQLAELIELIRTSTHYDFTQYKTGTLKRRIHRRMNVLGAGPDDIDAYIAGLANDGAELELLAKELLINVTGFFRDPDVFAMLLDQTFPELIRDCPANRPLRIWIAGCSSGEEAYSIAIVASEAIARAGSDVKLQVFASDLDDDAVTQAREGIYPATISTTVSAERLQRFFTRHEDGYRLLPTLHGNVIFTVQDVLADPPFSRIDLISCRNLLIYLGAEAQRTVVKSFHFSLRPGGILLLGSSETVGESAGSFEIVSKPERLYRRIGRNRPAEVGLQKKVDAKDMVEASAPASSRQTRHVALAELARRTVMEAYAPAAVLINRQQDCLFSLGPTDRYLKVAAGFATQNLVSMLAPELRTQVASALRQAGRDEPLVVTAPSRLMRAGRTVAVRVEVRCVRLNDEDLLLVSFIEAAVAGEGAARPASDLRGESLDEIEGELEATRAELRDALRDLDVANEEQRTINEEALSVNEEYQSTNEELLTSKEELQSLNEELTALNSQLQETLSHQRRTSNDLQNVLYSTDVATLFLDTDLNIRFFTPATQALFRVIPGDIGRPLSDLNSLALDAALPGDAVAVLGRSAAIEREIQVPGGAWFKRKILPYLTLDHRVEGVVITFTDITEAKRVAHALEAAKREAELATIAKSRFLAAASHDLRQPLQSLVLLQGLLAKSVNGGETSHLVGRMDKTLASMAGMLNTLLDIKQIEAGVVRPELVDFAVGDLLLQLEEEFADQASSQKLALRRVASRLSVRSDPGLLGQILRNLISNALKYTKRGKVLIGCRRRGPLLRIEVWDTGLGIAEEELEAIFEEYHQVDNVARERSLGLGLGLPIVQRLANLLDHKVSVHSIFGKGSVFTIDVPIAVAASLSSPGRPAPVPVTSSLPSAFTDPPSGGTVLIIEDDPDVGELLELLLAGAGRRTVRMGDGVDALAWLERNQRGPDAILTDYNLPGGVNGVEVACAIRQKTNRTIPVVVLTGDISMTALKVISDHDCVQLNKPVDAGELTRLIDALLKMALPEHRPALAAGKEIKPGTVYVVDDDRNVLEAIQSVVEADGRKVQLFDDALAFLAELRPGEGNCLLLDARMPGFGGLEVLRVLHERGHHLPTIMITGHGDVSMAVAAMKAGALDLIEKPVGSEALLASIERALSHSHDAGILASRRDAAKVQIDGLTARQHEIMDLVLAGHPSKNIAADLGISQRTVENHRAAIMTRTGSKSLPDLARLAVIAASGGAQAFN